MGLGLPLLSSSRGKGSGPRQGVASGFVVAECVARFGKKFTKNVSPLWRCVDSVLVLRMPVVHAGLYTSAMRRHSPRRRASV